MVEERETSSSRTGYTSRENSTQDVCILLMNIVDSVALEDRYLLL